MGAPAPDSFLTHCKSTVSLIDLRWLFVWCKVKSGDPDLQGGNVIRARSSCTLESYAAIAADFMEQGIFCPVCGRFFIVCLPGMRGKRCEQILNFLGTCGKILCGKVCFLVFAAVKAGDTLPEREIPTYRQLINAVELKKRGSYGAIGVCVDAWVNSHYGGKQDKGI